MKKIYGLIIFIVLVFAAAQINHGSKVFEVKSPSEIFIDINNNLIFDEKTPVRVSKILYIKKNTDYEKHPIFKFLTEEEKFFLEYKALETAENILKNRYVKAAEGDILINNKSYTKEILASKYVFDGTEASAQKLVDNIKSINLDDYVILNLKNKKYHTLSCESGRKSQKYKIVKLSEVQNNAVPCKSCHLFNERNVKAISLKQYSDNIYSDNNIKIFFIDLNKIFKPDNSCKESACKALKMEIDNAEKSIDFAIYGINNQPEIMKSLINAYNRGVKIRRVYDYSDKKYYEDNDKLDSIITGFKTDEQYDKSLDSALMHNKYFIFDNKTVWTGSSNISSTDLSGFNANYTVIINSKEIAAKYKEDFEQMYKGIFHKSKKCFKTDFIEINPNTYVKPMFSPQDNIINSTIIPLIIQAKKYIYMPAFFITHKGVEQALIDANKRGVEIKIINDATNAHTKYTIHKNLRKEGIKVKTENYAGKLHAKVIIIDNEYCVIGSMNFTNSGNSRNDENVMIIKSSSVADFMNNTFTYLWNKIPQKYENIDPKAESKDSIGSCFDGIDNDFDNKIDMMDEGCMFGSVKPSD